MQKAVTKVADAAKNHGKALGMHADAGMLERWIPHGVRLVMHSMDITILSTGLKNVRETIQRMLP
jgi:2-keto-3-deoxy-L-rhamnonate aldolase RhmA